MSLNNNSIFSLVQHKRFFIWFHFIDLTMKMAGVEGTCTCTCTCTHVHVHVLLTVLFKAKL